MDLLVFFIDWCRHFLNFPTLPISLRYSFIFVGFISRVPIELRRTIQRLLGIVLILLKMSHDHSRNSVRCSKKAERRLHNGDCEGKKKRTDSKASIEFRLKKENWKEHDWPMVALEADDTLTSMTNQKGENTHTHTHTHTQPAMEFRTRDVTEERPIAEEKSCPPLLGLQVKLEKPYVSFPPASINTNEEASQGTKKNKKRTLDPLTSLTFERTRSITSGFSQSSLKNKKKSTVAGKRLHNCWLLSTIQWNRKNNYSVKSFKRTESITSGFNQT